MKPPITIRQTNHRKARYRAYAWNEAPRAEPVVPLRTPVGRNPERVPRLGFASLGTSPELAEGRAHGHRPWCESKDRQHIEVLRRRVNRALERLFAEPKDVPHILHEGMRYCVCSDGKRFRPLLCLAASQAVGMDARRVLPVACAIELIHTYSLVHDDLPSMDNASERRGKPTCHQQFGEGNAILIGDALLTLAFDLLGRSGLVATQAIIGILAQASGPTGLIGGQVMDLVAAGSPDAREDLLKEIARRKTAVLITASVITGGLAGGASRHQLAWFERYGQSLGLAFQLIDDVHDGEGLLRVMTPTDVIAEAKRLITQAIHALEPFGYRAGLLRDMAIWLQSTLNGSWVSSRKQGLLKGG